MSDHTHYAIVFDVHDNPEDQDDYETRVEVYHDGDEAYNRWTELSDMGYGCLAVAGCERREIRPKGEPEQTWRSAALPEHTLFEATAVVP